MSSVARQSFFNLQSLDLFCLKFFPLFSFYLLFLFVRQIISQSRVFYSPIYVIVAATFIDAYYLRGLHVRVKLGHFQFW